VRTSLVLPYAAYLRVYEPLAAFPEPERSHWYGYAASGEHPDAQQELRGALARLLAVPPLPVPERESRDAFVRTVDGVVHICPWQTRLRARLALRELGGLLPRPVLDAAFPAASRERAEADHQLWREKNPDARPWILGACWQVPVRWFALFEDAEREFDPEARTLLYRTTMTRARQRTARSLRVLRESAVVDGEGDEGAEGVLVAGLEEVGRWLEEFHPRSLVELDYGGLASALPLQDLAADHSAADLAAGLAALRAGRGAAAGEHYLRLQERWRAVQHRQLAN
jgi:hypothetical protein